LSPPILIFFATIFDDFQRLSNSETKLSYSNYYYWLPELAENSK